MNGVWKRNARATIRVAGRALAALALAGGAYAAAGLIGGAIPSNSGWRPPADGVTVWVESNGVHTGIVVPKVAAGVDWRPLLRPEHLADPRYAGWDYAAIGWGERDFYVKTPTWWDVRPTTVAAAAFGSDRVLVHVDHVRRPRPGDGARAIVLRPEEYRRLAGFIRASFAPGGERVRGYGTYDVFYGGRGHYSGLATCNAWTGDALRHAGVRVGAWTPFPATVMWWFPAALSDRPGGGIPAREGDGSMIGWILLGIVVVAVLYVIVIYNGLVRLRALVREGFSGITVQLRRRADLIPNLVETVKGYAAHEQGTLNQITAQRAAATSAGSVAQTAAADAQMTGLLGRLTAIAEDYPELKADANFRQLQDELSEIEEELAGSRRYYNATVRDLNSRIQSFPAVLVAGPLGFKEEESYADADPAIQSAPKVAFGS